MKITTYTVANFFAEGVLQISVGVEARNYAVYADEFHIQIAKCGMSSAKSNIPIDSREQEVAFVQNRDAGERLLYSP